MSLVKRRIAPCVVDLTASSEEDDDGDVVLLTEFPTHLSHRTPRKPQSNTIAAVSPDLVILEEVDKTIELHFGVGIEKESQKESQASSQNWSVLDDVDDECCILSEDPSKVVVVKPSCGNDSDDLVMTGEVGQVACRDFPHARHQCVQFPFKTTAHEVFCSQCHCYVCDTLAPCSRWGNGTSREDHCHASDRIGEKWKTLRQSKRLSHSSGCSDPMALQQLQSSRGRPPSAAGNSDSTPSRGVAGCRPSPGDLPAQHYSLQISLNRQNRDHLSSYPRGHHSEELGVRTKVFSHGYMPRKDHRFSNLYLSYQYSRGGDGYQRRRLNKRMDSLPKYNCSEIYPPHSSPRTSSIERSQVTFGTAAQSRRPNYIAVATVQQEPFGGNVPHRGTVQSERSFMEELSFSPVSSNPDRTQQDVQYQSLDALPPPSVSKSATRVSQNEIGNSHSQGNEPVGSGNPVLLDTQFSRGGSLSEDMTHDDMFPTLPTSPSLLEDYLLDEDSFSFWNDLELEDYAGM